MVRRFLLSSFERSIFHYHTVVDRNNFVLSCTLFFTNHVRGEGERSSIDFNESVSQGQLQGAITKVMEGVNEHIMKSVTDAIVKLNLGNIGHTLERLDKRLFGCHTPTSCV
jgi:hypothetical protein